MDYITKSQIEQYTGLQIDATLDTFLALITGFAKNYIDLAVSSDEFGQRWFDDADAESTRYFNGNGQSRLYVDDLRSVTTLVASITRGNGIALVANQDFYTYPLNAIADGIPFEWIDLANPAYNMPANSRLSAFGGGNAYVFFQGQRNIAVTGKWGYNALDDGNLPPVVVMAALKICGGIIKENIGDTDLKELTAEALGEYSASYAKVKDIADRLEIGDILAPLVREKKTSETSGTRLAS